MLNIWRYIPAKIQAINARFSNPIFDFYNSTLLNHYSTFIFQKSIFNFSRLRIDFVQLCERRAVIRKTRGAGEREREGGGASTHSDWLVLTEPPFPDQARLTFV